MRLLWQSTSLLGESFRNAFLSWGQCFHRTNPLNMVVWQRFRVSAECRFELRIEGSLQLATWHDSRLPQSSCIPSVNCPPSGTCDASVAFKAESVFVTGLHSRGHDYHPMNTVAVLTLKYALLVCDEGWHQAPLYE